MLVERKLNYDAAIQAAYEGKTVKRICLALGCSYYLFCQEIKNNPSFSQALRDAIVAAKLLLADKLQTLHEDMPGVDAATLNVVSSNYKYLLTHYLPEQFGNRVEINHNRVDVRGAIDEANKRRKTIDVSPRLVNPLDD